MDAPASDFAYLSPNDLYFDAACQTLRPQPVINAVNEYYHEFNACGGRVRYAWGQRVDAIVAQAREHLLKYLGLSKQHYVTTFGLNTTMGINLLLQQLPQGKFRQIVTTHTEHNSVFLPTLTAARRLGVPRQLLTKTDNTVEYDAATLDNAVVVLGAVSNFDGSHIANLRQLVDDTHAAGGIIIIDAAQAYAHHLDVIHNLPADAIVGSAHKMYGPSLGIMAVRRSLISLLDPVFLGGGTVGDVTESDFTFDPEHPWAQLEPGLQDWAGIVGFEAALTWLDAQQVADRMKALTERFWTRLADVPQLTPINTEASPVVSVVPEILDAHTLATFFSKAGIMVRSGYFCAHHELKEHRGLPHLIRFSLSLSLTPDTIDQAFDAMTPMLKGLA